MALQFQLPQWYDLHVHLRQDHLLSLTIADQLKSQCAGVVAMPNTKPPVAKVFEHDPLPYQSIENYRQQIIHQGGHLFDPIIVPLYLTKDTTVDMIEAGAESGLLKACKYYPPGGTTNAQHSIDFQYFIDNGIFEAMSQHGIILCVHGEEVSLSSEQYFDRHINAEEAFYHNQMIQLHKLYPQLKVVCEHVSTKAAVDFVHQANDNVAATITPQHLLFTISHLLQGLKYHLYCLPLLKYEQDRQALREAVTDPKNRKFFAGTDSAPHTNKATDCGCAAGCYTAPIAPQLYAQAFEAAGMDLAQKNHQEIFKQFLCYNGADFYQLPIPKATFTLIRQSAPVDISHDGHTQVIPLPVGMNPHHSNEPTRIAWSIKSSDSHSNQ